MAKGPPFHYGDTLAILNDESMIDDKTYRERLAAEHRRVAEVYRSRGDEEAASALERRAEAIDRKLSEAAQ